jgi:hypothetical protein
MGEIMNLSLLEQWLNGELSVGFSVHKKLAVKHEIHQVSLGVE